MGMPGESGIFKRPHLKTGGGGIKGHMLKRGVGGTKRSRVKRVCGGGGFVWFKRPHVGGENMKILYLPLQDHVNHV